MIRALTWTPTLETVPFPGNKTLLGTYCKHNHNGAAETSAHLWRRDSLETKKKLTVSLQVETGGQEAKMFQPGEGKLECR